MNRLFKTIGAVVVLFITSMVCVVGACVVFEHLRSNYYDRPVDFGLGAVVVLFVASMICVFLSRKPPPVCRFQDKDSPNIMIPGGTVTIQTVTESKDARDAVYQAPERYGTVNTPRSPEQSSSPIRKGKYGSSEYTFTPRPPEQS